MIRRILPHLLYNNFFIYLSTFIIYYNIISTTINTFFYFHHYIFVTTYVTVQIKCYLFACPSWISNPLPKIFCTQQFAQANGALLLVCYKISAIRSAFLRRTHENQSHLPITQHPRSKM